MMVTSCPKIILLIEDNADHAFMFKLLMEETGVIYSLYHLTDAEEALKYLNRYEKYTDVLAYPFPDVIFLDLNLPKIDGFEFLKQIKSSDSFNTIPVVITTSSPYNKDREKAFNIYNISEYLLKPMNIEELKYALIKKGFNIIPA